MRSTFRTSISLKTCLPLSALRAHPYLVDINCTPLKNAIGARDKATIYSFAVLFIECLTFLPTFVHTIIFMYYVINKGGPRVRAGLNWPEREPRSKLLKT